MPGTYVTTELYPLGYPELYPLGYRRIGYCDVAEASPELPIFWPLPSEHWNGHAPVYLAGI